MKLSVVAVESLLKLANLVSYKLHISIAYIAYLQSKKVTNNLEKIFLYITGLFPLYHVLVNDAIYYGLYI